MAVSDRFSLHRYSLGSEDNRLEMEAAFSVSLNTVAGAAIPIDSTAFFGNNFMAAARGTTTLPSGFAAGCELFAQTEMRANIAVKPLFLENLHQQSVGAKNIYIIGLFQDGVQTDANAGKDMPVSAAFLSECGGSAYVSKTILCEQMFSAALSALTEAGTQETESTLISIAIPPGAELRIDSDTFQVTLNGENILYAQSGDWIHVSRELLRLDVESASGGSLEGALVYTERYL